MDAKKIKIDFLYLDNQDCTRCSGTEKQLDETLQSIGPLLTSAGYQYSINKMQMDSRDKAIQYQFISSPTIRINDVDLGFEYAQNECSDCGELCGCGEGTLCRAWIIDGKEFDIPPKELLTDRLLRVIFGNINYQKKDFELPENLENFYKGVEQENESECCESNCCS